MVTFVSRLIKTKERWSRNQSIRYGKKEFDRFSEIQRIIIESVEMKRFIIFSIVLDFICKY